MEKYQRKSSLELDLEKATVNIANLQLSFLFLSETRVLKCSSLFMMMF